MNTEDTNKTSDLSQDDNTPANYQIGSFLPENLNVIAKGKFDSIDYIYFTRLLAGSISLSKVEKKRIVDSAENLSEEQFKQLIKIFEEEKTKFAKLSSKHIDYLTKLDKQHFEDWKDLELSNVQNSKKQEDEDKAAEIRKQLGL